MSIFSRVVKIIQASIGFGFEVDIKAEDFFQEEFKKYHRNKRHRNQYRPRSSHTSGNEKARQPNPPIDSELAQYYANLEVPYGADRQTVRAAWKRLLIKYHPDKHSRDPGKAKIANELVQGINHAYEELEKRFGEKGIRIGL